MKYKSQEDFEKALAALGELDEATKKSVVCSLIGHSRIQNTCFGYYNCARCGDQLGDTLASIYPGAAEAVVVGHKCEVCVANYEKCTWEDKFLAPDPFAEETISDK